MRTVAWVVGAFLVLLGFWAFLFPRSFFERIAAFPPYNRHLVHDIGAFQVGLGATLLFAMLRRDAVLVALAGAGVGLILHFFSHLLDRSLGGQTTDPVSTGLLAAVVALAAVWQARGSGSDKDD